MSRQILTYYLKRIKRYFDKNTRSRALVAFLMVGIILLLSWGIFYLVKQGLQATQTGPDPFIAKAAPLYIYQSFLLITGFLVFVSAVIFGLFNFFKQEKSSWIMVSPKYTKMPWINLFRAIISSSWPVIIIAIPLSLATGAVFGISLFELLLVVLTIVFFSLFCTSLAITIILAASFLIRHLKKTSSFKLLTSIVSLFSLLIGVLIWQRMVRADLAKIFQIQEISDPALNLMKSNFSIFPSHIPAMAIFKIQEGELVSALQYGGLMTLLLLSVFVVFFILRSRFLIIWQSFQEEDFEAKSKNPQKNKGFNLRLFPQKPQGVIFIKELFMSIRSPKNFLWFLFLKILLIAQIGVINLLHRYSSGDFMSNELIPAVQIGIVLFFISAFVLRFVFPSFSQEGNTAWIMGAAPIDLRNVFLSKYKFYGTTLSLVGIIAMLFYIIPLAVTIQLSLSLIMVTVVGILSLTMLGLSLGSIFINLETNDPHALSTSAPGIGLTLVSLTYSALTGYLFYISLSQASYWPAIFFVLLSLFIYSLSQYLALRSLKKIEFS